MSIVFKFTYPNNNIYNDFIKMFANIDVFHKLIRNRDNDDDKIPYDCGVFDNIYFDDDYYFYPKYIYMFDKEMKVVWHSYKVRSTHDYIRKMLKSHSINFIEMKLSRLWKKYTDYNFKFICNTKTDNIPNYDFFMNMLCICFNMNVPEDWRNDCMELSDQICNEIKEKVLPIPQNIPELDYTSGYETESENNE